MLVVGSIWAVNGKNTQKMIIQWCEALSLIFSSWPARRAKSNFQRSFGYVFPVCEKWAWSIARYGEKWTPRPASEPRVYCTKYISKSYQKMKHASNCSELICKHVYIFTRLRSDEHYIIRWQVTCCKFRSCLVYETPLKYKSKHTNMKHFSIVLNAWYF